MQYVFLIIDKLAEKRIIGVIDQFSHRPLINRAETSADSSVTDCLKTSLSAAMQKPYQAMAA